MMNEVLERFAKVYPIPVALPAMLERVLAPDILDQWFNRTADNLYTRNLLFSMMYELMGLAEGFFVVRWHKKLPTCWISSAFNVASQ
ncbi:MAG: hypothetical protein P8Y45_16685 [Exilibacterium sp.]